MRRRELLLGFVAGSVASAASQPAHGQPAKVPRIAFVGTTTAGSDNRVQELVAALRERGYVEGGTIHVEALFANRDPERLRLIAEELAHGSVNLIVVSTAGVAATFRKATDRIPIVVWSAGDLEGTGLVQSLRRPGGNVTGIQILSPELMTKRLELLSELVPNLRRIGFVKPITRAGFITSRYLEITDEAARALGIELLPYEVHHWTEFEGAFSNMVKGGLQAALVIGNPLSFDHRVELGRAAAISRLPTMFELRQFVEAGGLISYGADRSRFAQLVAGYVDRERSLTR